MRNPKNTGEVSGCGPTSPRRRIRKLGDRGEDLFIRKNPRCMHYNASLMPKYLYRRCGQDVRCEKREVKSGCLFVYLYVICTVARRHLYASGRLIPEFEIYCRAWGVELWFVNFCLLVHTSYRIRHQLFV